MTKQMDLGGSFTLPGTLMTLNRMGYGAMQLAGPGVWDHRAMLTVRLRFCERRLRPASITSIPATFTDRM